MQTPQLPNVVIDEEALAKLSPERKAGLQQLLGEIQAAFEANPLNAYRPLPKQHLFHLADTKVKAFIGGNRSGKTTAGVADNLIQALDEEWVPKHLRPYKHHQPPFKCRIFTPDFGHTLDQLQEKIQELVPQGALKGGSWENGYAKADRILRFANGSMFDFMSYVQEPEQLGSVKRHRVHYDEEPPEGHRKQSKKRLIDYDGDELFTFTPELGISWTYNAVYERREEPGFTVLQVGMMENTHLSEDAVAHALEDLTDEERKIALSGEFVPLKGIFYPEFSERTHVVDPPDDVEKQDAIVVVIDPGYQRTGVLWLAYDSQNAALAFDELFIEQTIPEEVAPEIHAVNKRWKIDDPEYVIDPSARNMSTVNRDQVQAAYARADIYCQEGQNSREAGILEVKRRLQKQTLVISRDCRRLRWELPRYARDPKSTDPWAASRSSAGGNELADCVRYGVMHRAWELPTEFGPKPRPASFEYEPPYRPRRQPAPPLGSWGG